MPWIKVQITYHGYILWLLKAVRIFEKAAEKTLAKINMLQRKNRPWKKKWGQGLHTQVVPIYACRALKPLVFSIFCFFFFQLSLFFWRLTEYTDFSLFCMADFMAKTWALSINFCKKRRKKREFCFSFRSNNLVVHKIRRLNINVNLILHWEIQVCLLDKV